MFDDPTDKINNLIFKIKSDLGEITSKCDATQKFVDENKRQNSKSQSADFNINVVNSLKTDLMCATKDFKSALEMRSTKMHEQQNKKMKLTGVSTMSPMRQMTPNNADSINNASALRPMSVSTSSDVVVSKYKSPNSLPNPYSSLSTSSSENYTNPSAASTFYNPYDSTSSQLQQHQLLVVPPSQNYYESREQAVTEVEKTIVELGSLFKRLSSMIAQQQELVDRIDSDIENAVDNTDKAKTALLNAYEAVSSNRGMYMKISAIMALFLIFFVLFLM